MNEERLRQCFHQSLGLPEESLTDELAYASVPQWDSIAHMALIAALESEFDVMLETEDILGMSSVGEARRILARYGIEFATA